jgi:hypothetical protein
MSPESAASINQLLLGTVLKNYPGFASNKVVAFPFLGARSSNCAKTQKKRKAQPIWLKRDEIARNVGRIYGDAGSPPPCAAASSPGPRS